MAEKVEGADPERWVEVEKSILLQTLDHHWKEHLATLDALRQVIHLRSYAQKKPIDEYKQEAFLLFERLLVAIREEVTRTLMRAQIQIQDPPPPPTARLHHHHIRSACRATTTRRLRRRRRRCCRACRRCIAAPPLPHAADGETSVAPESRNAPCPCGSGRKYQALPRRSWPERR